MIGLGVVSCNRPAALHACLESVERHVARDIDVLFVHDDGSDPEERAIIGGFRHRFPSVRWMMRDHNRGVSVAKNWLMASMLAAGCDWLFLLEDDAVLLDGHAVAGYVRACELSGLGHLAWHCAPAGYNTAPLRVDGPVTLWPHTAGVFACYSREALTVGGLFDERFRAGWGHIEHTARLAAAGFTPVHTVDGNADATGSEQWLALQDVPSVRLARPGIQAAIADELAAWEQRRPFTFRLVHP